MSNDIQTHDTPAQQPARGALRDAMIDIESLGTRPGAAILSIGAVMFGAAGLGETFYAPVSLSSCTAVGLSIDGDTVAWWMRQGDAARDAAFRADAAPLADVLRSFADWFVAQLAEHPWCHGATFDVPLLDAAYQACGMMPPWSFWNVRDTRTLYDLAGVKVDRAAGTHHNALDDAVAQARAAVRAMRILRARAEASTMSDALLNDIGDAFVREADADSRIAAGGPARLLAFDYYRRGWLGNGAAVEQRLAGPAAA